MTEPTTPAQAAPASPPPPWYEALLAWYLGWLGKVFTGKL